MRCLPVVTLALGVTAFSCKSGLNTKVYDFDDEPVAEVSAEFFDVAISLQSADQGEIGVEAAHNEEEVSFKTTSGIYKTLTSNGQIKSTKVTFEVGGNTIFVLEGGDKIGRLGKASGEGLVTLNEGTFNVRVVNLKGVNTLVLEDPILAVASQKSSASSEINEFNLDSQNNFQVESEGKTKTIAYDKAMIVRPEFEQSGIMSPRVCTLVRAGDFIYAKVAEGKDKVPVAHVGPNNSVKMLSGYKSRVLQVANQDFLWISPR